MSLVEPSISSVPDSQKARQLHWSKENIRRGFDVKQYSTIALGKKSVKIHGRSHSHGVKDAFLSYLTYHAARFKLLIFRACWLLV